MKIGGVTPSVCEEYLILPRPQGDDLVFHARAVADMSEFDRLVPEPKAKPILVKGGWKDNVDDPAYQEAVRKRDELRVAWMCIRTLEPSEIEWDTVEEDKPSTWLNWYSDLENAGLSVAEIQRIIYTVTTANSLNEEKLEEARDSFLRGLEQASGKSTGPSSEPPNTASGEPANG